MISKLLELFIYYGTSVVVLLLKHISSLRELLTRGRVYCKYLQMRLFCEIIFFPFVIKIFRQRYFRFEYVWPNIVKVSKYDSNINIFTFEFYYIHEREKVERLLHVCLAETRKNVITFDEKTICWYF